MWNLFAAKPIGLGYKITKVFLTHAHPDHRHGLDELLSKHQIPFYISKFEYPPLRPKVQGIIDVTEKDKLSVGNINFDILHTPGPYTRLSMLLSPRTTHQRRYTFYRWGRKM